MQTDPHIQVSREGAVQSIRFDRADKKNAITRTMYAAMTSALRHGEADDAIGAHLILGQPGVFSSGNDMQDFMAFAMSGEMGNEVLEFLHTLPDLKKPVVSAVDGLAIGIGTTIHMHCDLTFATPRSLFKTPFVDLALVPEAGSSLLAPASMGYQRAFAMLAMGEDFSAEAAREAGLIYKVVDEANLEAEAFAAAANLAARPPVALSIAKQLLKSNKDGLAARIDEEAMHFEAQLKSEEAKAAFMAFMARKKAH
ncbi:MAG: crotonase/enoyl-CoA hydratase family protein, partial [Pseudomonadota bacterium]